jgi:hypothetical protein
MFFLIFNRYIFTYILTANYFPTTIFGLDRDEEIGLGGNATAQTRQMPVYLFQGQYLAEPRLNMFIDGAIRNLAIEMRTAILEPIYFRVLPRGRVV